VHAQTAGHICGMDTIKLTGPADLITAVPALLGLVPTRSAVLICMGGPNAGRVDLLMRVDLPDPHEVGDIPNQVSELADLCVRRGAAAVSLVVVEDRAPIAGDVAHRGFVRALRRELNRSGTQLSLAVSTTAITTGSVWHDYLGAATGVLPDPSASIVGAAHVAAGRVIHADRASVATTFTPDPPWLLDQRAETMARLAATTGATKPRQYESLLSAVGACVDLRSDPAQVLTPTGLAEIGVALSDLTLRDACFGLSIGPSALAAGRLWVYLTRALPVPARAEAAVLAAFSFYLGDEGILAGAALDVALGCVPGHRMAILLSTALRGGMSPEQMRGMAESGAEIAAELA